MKSLTLNDIDKKVRSKIYLQSYPKQELIEGVKIIDLDYVVNEEGLFSEIMRIKNGEVSLVPGFKIAQINCSLLFAGVVKAWHLHLRQNELWYVVSQDHLLVGLWDVRKNSKTKGRTMRIIMGGGKSQLLYIPYGVAHGLANLIDRPVAMWYFTDQHFDPKNPDEQRINWDAQGAKFWSSQRD